MKFIRMFSFILTLSIGASLFSQNVVEDRKSNPGKPKEVSVVFTVSNSTSSPVEVVLNYQAKKNKPVTDIQVGTVPAQSSRRFNERVVYNGLTGPNGKNGAIRIYRVNEESPLAQYSFYVENVLNSHNPKGNQVNSLTEQIDIALLDFPEFHYVISVNPKHK